MKSPHEMKEAIACQNSVVQGINELKDMVKGFLGEVTPNKVILVDNDPLFLEVFDRHCKDSGYDEQKLKLLTACNGEELKAVLKDNGDPILLVDIHLLLENGVDLVKSLMLPETYKVFFLSDCLPDRAVMASIRDMGAKFRNKPLNLDAQKRLLDELFAA